MASFRKRGDKWYAEIYLKGIRKSQSFPTKGRAQAWATITESEILDGKHTAYSNKTFGQLLEEYSIKVSPTKETCRQEQNRIKAFQKDVISDVKLSELDQSHFADWRDRRRKEVSDGTVIREWNILSGACSVALHEWKWITYHPLHGVKKPPTPPARDRLVSRKEIEAIQHALGYMGGVPTLKKHYIALAFEFACETGMRAQEICNLTRENIEGSTADIKKSKTKAGVRIAPLTPRALEIINLLPTDSLFDVKKGTLDTMFREAKKSLGIINLKFHDSRHQAVTMLARKLTVLELSRSIGHANLNQLGIYFNETAAEIAKKLS